MIPTLLLTDQEQVTFLEGISERRPKNDRFV